MQRALDSQPHGPHRRLRWFDAVAIVVGVVIGAGIFRAPGMVASGADSELAVLGLWALGGVVSIAGALCYGELACAFPSAGGEYHFLTRAYGRNLGLLFAWARVTVTTTGSIAILAFVFADYAAAVLPIGDGSGALYAAGVVCALTALNVLGLRIGTAIQNVFTALVVLGLLAMVTLGLSSGGADSAARPPSPATSPLGLAMVFVLLTYGGWNEAAYLSAEVRGGRRRIAGVILAGVGAVAVLYLLVNAAYIHVLGLDGLRASTAVGADLMQRVLGPAGAHFISVLVAAAVLTSINATIVTGSRTSYALGRDFRVFRPLGAWNPQRGAPVPALLAQGLIVLALIGLGALSRRGFETMVAYTAPVFWAFFLLTGLSVFVLRAREPSVERPFRVPLYPLTPLVFCASCAWLLHASLAYSGIGAIVGIAVLASGVVPLWLEHVVSKSRREEMPS